MRFWWLIDRVRQNHFTVHWSPGATNLADYFSKHHSPSHHAKMRKTFLYTDKETSPTYSEVARVSQYQILRAKVYTEKRSQDYTE